jgi:hypothetical protein
MPKKLTKAQQRRLLEGAHGKIIKLYTETERSSKIMTAKDLLEIEKIFARIYSRF